MLPYKAPTDGPLADAVRDAMKFAFGREPVFVREGGSIGAVVSMEKVLRCPVLFLGLSLPEHGYHAPNENYDWQQASGGHGRVREVLRERRRALGHLAGIPRPRADDLVPRVLLDRVADPADGAADREERERRRRAGGGGRARARRARSRPSAARRGALCRLARPRRRTTSSGDLGKRSRISSKIVVARGSPCG